MPPKFTVRYSSTPSCLSSTPFPTPALMPDPMPNSIGNFFENKTDDMSFIQCYMTSMCKINGNQYGVGFPVDMPVMLSYFEGNELKPVRPDYLDFDHLVNYVANQLDYSDFQLYKTPVVLTLQGEFEDEVMNELLPTMKHKRKDISDDDDDKEPWEEISVDELIKLEGIDEEEFDEEDEDEDDDDEDEEDEEEDENGEDYVNDATDEEEIDEEDDQLGDDEDEEEDEDDESNNRNMQSFWRSSPAGIMDEKYRKMPDYSLYRPENPDISDIPADAFVTDEDTKGLRRAHRRADRIMEYASDVALIASFHYKKKNFHLVKLLEPIFIIGKRIEDIKGYYFTLLKDDEGDRIAPVIERLVLDQAKNKANKPPAATKPDDWRKRSRRSRRRWTSRQKDKMKKADGVEEDD